MADGPSTSRLVLLPGLGADRSMYAGPWRSLPRVHCVDWPPFAGETTLRQLAERVIEFHGITKHDDLGGTSLGGMIALEMAQRLGQKRVLLLSSATSPSDVYWWLRVFRPLAHVAPLGLAKEIIGRSPRPSASMLRRAHTEFLRNMCLAIPRWDGYHGPTDGLVRIHGDRDGMIRCPPDAHKVRGAGHLAVLTHPDECVRLVRAHWYGETQTDASA